MDSEKLREALRAHFDAGQALSAELKAALASSPEAAAYWQRLQALDAALWQIPLEEPAPDFVPRLAESVAREHRAQRWRQVGMASALAAVSVVSVVIGWRFPEYATLSTWWRRFPYHLTEQAWLEQMAALRNQMQEPWAALAATWSHSAALPLTVWFSALAGAVVLLILFNATGAHALRVAGGVSFAERSQDKEY